MSDAETKDEKILVGAVAGAFGVRGDVRIKSFCADPAAIADYPLTSDHPQLGAFRLKGLKPIKNGYSARLPGVANKEQADRLKGAQLFTERANLANLPDDEFYHADLIGLTVLDSGGAELGRIHAIHDFGAGDMLEITGPGLKQPVLLPFTQEAVPTVDLAARRVIIDPPEGAFP